MSISYFNIKQKNKVILHMDGDAFFVACEIAKNPKLKGKSVVTGEERGIVSALSYEAKALGITRGTPIFKVKKDFPKTIILPGDYASYVKYSGQMFDIVRKYVDDVEEYSIDECFADLTGLDKTLNMTYLEIAEKIKTEVNNELKLSVSIGLAPTKVLAKVASNWVKPNGLTVIEPTNIKEFLVKKPIEKIWGIGPKTASFLIKNKINYAQEFIEKGIVWVKENLPKPYQIIWAELSGNYVMKIDPNPKNDYSSIQKTRSFHPATNDKSFLIAQLSKHIEEACTKSRHYNLFPKKVSFFLKTKDFSYKTYSINLPSPTNTPEVILDLILKFFDKIYSNKLLFRTTGVTLYELTPNSYGQEDLFGESTNIRKFEMIHKEIDKLEKKFGKRVVHLASTQKAIRKKNLGTDSEDLDRDLLFL